MTAVGTCAPDSIAINTARGDLVSGEWATAWLSVQGCGARLDDQCSQRPDSDPICHTVVSISLNHNTDNVFTGSPRAAAPQYKTKDALRGGPRAGENKIAANLATNISAATMQHRQQ